MATDLSEHDRYRRQISDRLHAFIKIEQGAEKAFAPFLNFNPEIIKCMLRLRATIDRAGKTWQHDAFDRALLHCDQLEGGLVELRSMLRELGVMNAYCDHMFEDL